ncbi:MAG: hypothetical protein IPH57_03305 [Saprospiraceae bacterium]|nr:hypothetical protein [Saprospiraceae bacterium]
MSLTGSNADNRILIKPSEEGSAILALYNEIARLTGGQQLANLDLNAKAKKSITELAKELAESKGRSLIVSGSNNVGEQIIINKINSILNNYGSTIDFTEASYQRQGDERELFSMIDEINNGSIDAVIFMESNPLYDFAGKEKLKTALSKLKLKVALAFSTDETSNECDYIAPVSHLLESWGDAMPKKGHYSLIQPAISTIFNTRQAEISLMNWSGTLNQTADQPYYTYLKDNWKQMFPQSGGTSFSSFWDKSLKEGVYYKAPASINVSFKADITGAASLIGKPSKGGMGLLSLKPSTSVMDNMLKIPGCRKCLIRLTEQHGEIIFISRFHLTEIRIFSLSTSLKMVIS